MWINKEITNIHFLFVPVDENIECFNVTKLKPRKDLFYAMSHGVNRANLKKGKSDERIEILNKIITKFSNIKYTFFSIKFIYFHFYVITTFS